MRRIRPDRTPRRLLFTNEHAGIGGGELALLAHVRFAMERGHHCHVVLLEDGPFVERLRCHGASVEVLPFAWQGSKVRSLRLLGRLAARVWRLIRRHRIDRVVSYTFTDFFIAAIAARLAGVPVLFRTQADVFPADVDRPTTWLGPLFLPFVRAAGARLACTTTGEAHRMIALGVPAHRVHAVHLGIDAAAVDAAPVAALPGIDRPLIGIFGRLVRWKGQAVFLEALGTLARDGVAFDAVVVGGSSFGDGSAYERELHELAAAQGLAERARFLGHRDDVYPIMKRCDIICHCSHREPFGLVVVEAMMAGKPVVASDVSGPREIIEPDVDGLLVPPGEPQRLAAALVRLLGDAALRERIGGRARDKALRMFEAQARLGEIEALVEEPAGRR